MPEKNEPASTLTDDEQLIWAYFYNGGSEVDEADGHLANIRKAGAIAGMRSLILLRRGVA